MYWFICMFHSVAFSIMFFPLFGHGNFPFLNMVFVCVIPRIVNGKYQAVLYEDLIRLSKRLDIDLVEI